VLNKVPDTCVIDIDIRYLPGQDAGEILTAIRALADTEVAVLFRRDPAIVAADHPLVRALAVAVAAETHSDPVSVGRDGTSDAISFLNAGVPAVEFGPAGGGHHGPDEWVSIPSLESYRRALVNFAHAVPEALGTTRLRIA
jgi:succinyl-diaminopimelate desuccinylase